MSRKRMIDPEFWRDGKVSLLSLAERLLFIGLWTFADDEGYGRASPELLRACVFPFGDVRRTAVSAGLKKMADLKMIGLYSAQGEEYYFVKNFGKYQAISHPSPSPYPRPDASDTLFSADSGNIPEKLAKDSRLIEYSIKEDSLDKESIGGSHTHDDKSGKIKYGEYVSLTADEYQKLVSAHGETGAKRLVELLDNYKGSHGRKYASDYRAILNWVVDRYAEEQKKHDRPAEAVYEESCNFDELFGEKAGQPSQRGECDGSV